MTEGKVFEEGVGLVEGVGKVIAFEIVGKVKTSGLILAYDGGRKGSLEEGGGEEEGEEEEKEEGAHLMCV